MWLVILMVMSFFVGFSAQAKMVPVPLAPGQGPLAGLKALHQNNDEVVLALGTDPRFVKFLPLFRHKDGRAVKPEETTRLKNGDLYIELPDSETEVVRVSEDDSRAYALAAHKAWEESRAKIAVNAVVVPPAAVPAKPVVVARVRPAPVQVSTPAPVAPKPVVPAAPKPVKIETEFVRAEITRIPEVASQPESAVTPKTKQEKPVEQAKPELAASPVAPIVVEPELATKTGKTVEKPNENAFKLGPDNPFLAGAQLHGPVDEDGKTGQSVTEPPNPKPYTWLFVGIAGLMLPCFVWLGYSLRRNLRVSGKKSPPRLHALPTRKPVQGLNNLAMAVNGPVVNLNRPVGRNTYQMPVPALAQATVTAEERIGELLRAHGLENFVVHPGIHRNQRSTRLQVMFAPGYDMSDLEAFYLAVKCEFLSTRRKSVSPNAGQAYDMVITFD